VRRFIKVELKRAENTCAELARRLDEHILADETEASGNSKLERGTFSVTWLIAVLAVVAIATLDVEKLRAIGSVLNAKSSLLVCNEFYDLLVCHCDRPSRQLAH
jgi:hypothetical protein